MNRKIFIITLMSIVFLGCSKEGDGPTPLHKEFQNIEIEILQSTNESTQSEKQEFELTLDNKEYSKFTESDWDEVKDFDSFYNCKKTVKVDTPKRIIKFQQRRVIFSFSIKDLSGGEYMSPSTLIIRINGKQKEVYQTPAKGQLFVINYQEK